MVNSAGNRVDFTISDMAGAVLWTDAITTNIPIGLPLGANITGSSTDTTANKFYMNADYLLVTIPVTR